MFAVSTNLVNLKVLVKELQIQSWYLNEPVLYYLHDGPKRGFVREELLVVPPDTVFPPANVLTH